MTRVLSLPTEHREVAAAVDAIATNIAESTVRAAAPEAVGGGEWVRFRWLLADGTPFFEGVGRCEACRPLGASGYDVVLSELSFDARNEAMFERILLSSEESGPRTGKLQAVPKVNGNGASASGAPASVAPARSTPAHGAPAKTAPAKVTPASVATVPAKTNGTPATPSRAIPARPPAAKLSEVPRTKPNGGTPPPLPRGGASISPDLAERARQISRRLNLVAPALAKGRWTEQRVIDTALHMGIEALEGLLTAHHDDE